MKSIDWLHRITVLILGVILMNACRTDVGEKFLEINREPVLEPDYSGVTIPANIAPLNFIIKEKGDFFRIKAISPEGNILSVNSSGGIVHFPVRLWKKLLSESKGGQLRIEILGGNHGEPATKFEPVYLNVSNEPADQYLCYRLLYPGYETYLDIKIVQRNISDFNEKSIVENQLLKHNCVNCHSFNKNNPERFMLHVRGDLGGTYFVSNKKITRTDLKTDQLSTGAVYPAWHPGGRYIAFSSNNIRQSFHSSPDENIEVTDLSSQLILYDTETNTLSSVHDTDTVKYMDTFPEWSPDGMYLYFCRALQYRDGDDFRSIRYNLMRKPFAKGSETFGDAEMIFNADAINKSVSFPRISPDGKYLVFTLHDFGNFSIWHKEADLYLLDLLNNKTVKMSINSNETESYHSWSSNSKWLVFSSKRGDGLTARPYFAYVGSPDQVGKPFVLPQKDPGLYGRIILTFNKPEFVTGKINLGPRDFADATGDSPLKGIWKENQ